MAKKHLLLLFVALMVGMYAVAGPRTFSQARQIAERKAASMGITIDSKAMAKAKAMNGGSQESVANYYVFPNGDDKGYIIVSGEDRMPELVGYSDRGTFDADNMPEAMSAFLADYADMVRAVQMGDESALKVLAERKAMNESVSTRATTAAVSPMLDGVAKWNQTAPFNNMCPKYDDTNLSATGCVATAMAEVMAYWKYPKTLQADIPAYTTKGSTSGKRIYVAGISAGEAYDWDNMLPRYTTGNYTQAQADAVAKLMYHCGVAVQMDYGPQSGAYVSSARLSKYFGYDSDLMMDVSRSSFTLAEWTAILDKELAAKRPVLYSGQSSDGGHQFVCDGSDGNGLYHINWGWGGYQDGYFDITILNPAKGGTGSGSAADGYNRGCGMIIGVQPDNGKADEPLVDMPSIVSYGNFTYNNQVTSIKVTQDTRTESTGKFGITLNQWWGNQSNKALSAVRVAFGISNGNGGYTIVSPQGSISSMSAMSPTGSMSLRHTTFNVSYAFKEGTYALYALYSTDGGNTWRKCAYANMHPYMLKVTSDQLTLLNNALTASITTDETLYNGAEGTFKLNVTNNGDEEYQGLISLYAAASATMPSTATTSVYMTVPANSTVTREVSITPSAVGDFYVWATDDSDGTLVDAAKFTVDLSTAPSFTLVDVQTNATEGAYESEKAYYYSIKIKTPRVDDDHAEFAYSIRNDGTTCTANCQLYKIDISNGSGYVEYRKVKFVGNGEVTKITFNVSPDDLGGGRCILANLNIMKPGATSEAYDIATTLPNVDYPLVDEIGYVYRIDAIKPIVYVAGKPTAIAGVNADGACGVRGGKGEIIVNMGKAGRVAVYGIDGRKVCDVQVEAGVDKSIGVASGIYVVGGRKVVVR